MSQLKFLVSSLGCAVLFCSSFGVARADSKPASKPAQAEFNLSQVKAWLNENANDQGWQETGNPTFDRDAWMERGAKFGKNLVPALLKLETNGDIIRRGRVLIALGDLAIFRIVHSNPVKNNDPLQNVLMRALGDKSNYLRVRVARSLAYCRGNDAVNPLIQALSDEDEEVRQYAASALGMYKDRRAIKPLVLALQDRSWKVRSAASSVWTLEDEKVIEPLINALFDPASSWAAGNIGFALKRFNVAVEPIYDHPNLLSFCGNGPRRTLIGYKVKRQWPK